MKTDVYEKAAATTTNRPSASKPVAAHPKQQEIMKKVAAAGRPGPAHQALNDLVGDWKAEVKCWMQPGSPPEVTEGAAQARWTLNNRFLEEDFHGQMMGKPFRGRTLLGYDNTKQTFNSVWVSDSQTSMFVSEGKGDGNYKTITLEGKASCAATGRKEVPMKTVLRVIDPNKHVFEMFDGTQGNAKTMEITYTRQ
ncbi:MAG TPA: DUF1579 domain-containing protein [Verrucomicrobiae bacterium]|nr:DUF1579 domain-containing protein [Verrucomicrobiae bacterium]